jgi:hypothetical protein
LSNIHLFETHWKNSRKDAEIMAGTYIWVDTSIPNVSVVVLPKQCSVVYQFCYLSGTLCILSDYWFESLPGSKMVYYAWII